WLLRAFGAHRSSALLPILIFGGALGLAIGPILPFAVALKAVDGSLRHTLYRSAVEVLYLPLDSRRRERAKGQIEVFGHRVGQALASVLIIAAVSVGLTTRDLALGLLLLVVGWLTAILSTRRQYVDQFRARLQHGVIDTRLELEELDRHSLDVLLNALNSDQDPEVLAAIDIFDRHGRTDSMPVLVLYHPSVAVRSRALEAFAEATDLRFVPVARRMLSDDDSDVRAAALRALTAVDPNRQLLEEKLDVEASIVRATALVGLLGMNQGNGSSVSASKLDEWIGSGNPQTQSSLARAIRHEGGEVFHESLIKLIGSDDDSVRLETLRAMAVNPDTRFLPHLLGLLGSSDLRAEARKALLAIGPEALAALEAALSDPSTPRKVRRRIPHTIILFEPQQAADILLRQLDLEHDGGVRSKILRALGRLQANQPSTVLDDAVLQEQLRASLLRVVRLLQWRAAIESEDGAETPDAELLRIALQDKERAALERAFWLMGLRHPEENFRLVWRGVTSENARLRAAGNEVLEATLPGSFREAVLAIVDDGESAERRARAAAAALGATLRPISHREAVEQMTQDRSEVIRGIASHHAAELGEDAAPDSVQEVQSLV
ncbi:MAG: Npt1/Npt2 family nucleotide transporter, partial [Polyangiales bacterium]